MKFINFLTDIIKEETDEIFDSLGMKSTGEKVHGFIDNIDGTTDAKNQGEYEKIVALLESPHFNNEAFQKRLNNLINKIKNPSWSPFYSSFRGWDIESLDIAERIEKKTRSNEYDDEYYTLRERYQTVVSKALESINKAIDLYSIEEEEDTDTLGFMYLCKANLLHDLSEHVNAVQTAIKGLSFAKTQDNRDMLVNEISANDFEGRFQNCTGYKIHGISLKEELDLAVEYSLWQHDENATHEDNQELFDICVQSMRDHTNVINSGKYTFSNRPLQERQFIFIARDLNHIQGCYDDSDNIQYVFPLKEIPRDITFPLGHPQANTLYYAHPLRPMYLPVEDAQLKLFYEKVQEVCRLFQCLGATQITTRCLKGEKVSESIISAYDAGVDMDIKGAQASVNINQKSSRTGENESRNEMNLTLVYEPHRAPYCPDDLLWAKHDPELLSLIKQRLEGNLLSFTKRISSYETSSLSTNQVTDVKAAFQFMMANVSPNYSSSEDTTFNSTSETEWEISVEFKPLNEFTPEQLAYTDKPQTGEFIMEVSDLCPIGNKECNELALIGTLAKDIKVGDKVILFHNNEVYNTSIIRIALFAYSLQFAEKNDRAGLILEGIDIHKGYYGDKVYFLPGSSDEPEKSEKTVKANNLSPEEEKYKEEVEFCLEEGGSISDDDRRYLERKKRKLGISDERALEIENMVLPGLTEQEQEYLEVLKDTIVDGVIPQSARRLLQREAKSLEISEERALELERMTEAWLQSTK